MALYPFWLLRAFDQDDADRRVPVDLEAQTLDQARVKVRCVWMETLAEGLRVYGNVSGDLVYEAPSGRPR